MRKEGGLLPDTIILFRDHVITSEKAAAPICTCEFGTGQFNYFPRLHQQQLCSLCYFTRGFVAKFIRVPQTMFEKENYIIQSYEKGQKSSSRIK